MKIQESYEFMVGETCIPAQRHCNPDGSRGGWVAANATVHPTAIIEQDAVVEPEAYIGPGVRVSSGTTVLYREKLLRLALVS